MNKIKKQFKDFWAYFRFYRFGANSAEAGKKFKKIIVALITLIIGVIILFVQLNMNLDFIIGVMLGVALATGLITSIRPSALSVAPFSPKQRMIFSLLSGLLLGVYICAIYLAVIWVLIGFIALIEYCVTGLNMFEGFTYVTPLPAYGVAFNILFVTLMFFGTYAIFHLERRRNINIAEILFVIGLIVFTSIVQSACESAIAAQSGNIMWWSYPARDIVYLYAPWVVILLLGIFNALAIAASVFLTIRRYKSDNI